MYRILLLQKSKIDTNPRERERDDDDDDDDDDDGVTTICNDVL